MTRTNAPEGPGGQTGANRGPKHPATEGAMGPPPLGVAPWPWPHETIDTTAVLNPPDHPTAGCHGLAPADRTLAMCGACDLLTPCREWAHTAPDLEPLAVVGGYSPAALAAARRTRTRQEPRRATP